MLLSIGVDFPEANTSISSDDSIAYTAANVKYPNQESEQDQPQDKPLTGKEAVENRSDRFLLTHLMRGGTRDSILIILLTLRDIRYQSVMLL